MYVFLITQWQLNENLYAEEMHLIKFSESIMKLEPNIKR